MRRFLGVIAILTVFLLLFCSHAVFADFSDEATIGGQDSDGNYRWRVTSDGHLRPGATDGSVDLGTTAAPVGEIHATTLYVSDGYSAQGKTASHEYAAGDATISLTYGLISKTIAAYTAGDYTDDMTIPDGTYSGETIQIMVEGDNGGYLVITPTTASGFTSIWATDVLDTVTLTWISSTYGWILTGQYGVTLE